MTEMIRGLTLRHPWAWAFLHGKDVENRGWRPERQGGKIGMFIALHGGLPPKRSDDEYHDEIAHALEWMEDLDLIPGVELPDFGHYYQRDIIPGLSPSATAENTAPFCPSGIVAVGRLLAVSDNSDSPWAMEDQQHWHMDVVKLPEPVPHRGAQGLWTLEPDALAQVRRGWQRALEAQP